MPDQRAALSSSNGDLRRSPSPLPASSSITSPITPTPSRQGSIGTPAKPRGPRDNWLPDDSAKSCMNCNDGFTLVRRRHHCRSCGGIFCDQCSSYRVKIPELKLDKPERVCLQCFWKVIDGSEAAARDALSTRMSSATLADKDQVVYNPPRIITTRAALAPSPTMLFPFLNKGFYAITSRVQNGDAFVVRDTAKFCLDHCTGVAPNLFNVVPGDKGQPATIVPYCGLHVEADYCQYELRDCFFSGLTAVHLNHSFLSSSISGGGLEAKPGCGLFIGAGVSYTLDIKQLKVVAEKENSSKLPLHIQRGCGMCLGGPGKVRLTDCQIKAGIGIWVQENCEVVIDGGSIVGQEAALLCEGPNSSVRISATTMIQGDLRTQNGGTITVEPSKR